MDSPSRIGSAISEAATLDSAEELPLSDLQQDISFAFFQALAAAAGVACEIPRKDFFGIDLQLRSRAQHQPIVELQVKCVLSDDPESRSETTKFRCSKTFCWDGKNGNAWYQLKASNQQALAKREKGSNRLLAVIVVPFDPKSWLEQNHEELRLRTRGYWLSLQSAPKTENGFTVRVEISRDQLITVETIKSWMSLALVEKRIENTADSLRSVADDTTPGGEAS